MFNVIMRLYEQTHHISVLAKTIQTTLVRSWLINNHTYTLTSNGIHNERQANTKQTIPSINSIATIQHNIPKDADGDPKPLNHYIMYSYYMIVVHCSIL